MHVAALPGRLPQGGPLRMGRPRMCKVLGAHDALQRLRQYRRRQGELLASELVAARVEPRAGHRREDAGKICPAADGEACHAADRLNMPSDHRRRRGYGAQRNRIVAWLCSSHPPEVGPDGANCLSSVDLRHRCSVRARDTAAYGIGNAVIRFATPVPVSVFLKDVTRNPFSCQRRLACGLGSRGEPTTKWSS